METLLLNRDCKANQRDLTRQVHSIRRKALFVTWFNLVHDELPKVKKALRHHKRSLFLNFANHVQAQRPIKAKKEYLATLEQGFHKRQILTRCLKIWNERAVYKVTMRSKVETMRETRLRRLFDGWWNSLDQLSLAKRREAMWRELNKQFSYRRVITALREYAD